MTHLVHWCTDWNGDVSWLCGTLPEGKGQESLWAKTGMGTNWLWSQLGVCLKVDLCPLVFAGHWEENFAFRRIHSFSALLKKDLPFILRMMVEIVFFPSCSDIIRGWTWTQTSFFFRCGWRPLVFIQQVLEIQDFNGFHEILHRI